MSYIIKYSTCIVLSLELSTCLLTVRHSYESIKMTLLNYMSVSPRARKLAIDVFRKFPPGEFLTTKQIYEDVIQKDVKTDLARVPLPALGKRGAVWRNKKGNIALPSMSLPPHPDHPVRSMR